ncbi:glycosyltransferase family 39 protein [Auriculariales sp. MPI-PUGE-AT-0066]|nr:glycosyltransferase family 39 protein [Auriculariales sp. MPI-PUGE-AT-0066]
MDRGVRRRHPLAEGLRVGSGHHSSSDTEHDAPSIIAPRLPLARGQGRHAQPGGFLETQRAGRILLAVLTSLAFFTRFYKISHPDQVVFDEVHFGKFAGFYVKREYYFDVHPPLAKLLLALAAWFVGFDGDFEFTTIGDSYTENRVPYIGIRALPGVLGSLTIPIVYLIMQESGYPNLVCAFSALIVLFDNAHIAQSRLILLDAQLIFFIALSIYSYVRFRKLRYCEFTPRWWFWLLATGFNLACSLGCKMVGLFTFATIGICVLVDLWEILDIRKNHSMQYFWHHFAARAGSLIVFPFIMYLSFFWIHFRILNRSGPGDTFMSPAFQETLKGNELLLNAHEVRYHDVVTIKHKETKVFLHSHPDKYPLRYSDGRISSQGQQVTGYLHNDTNNHWEILPTKALPATGRGRIVRHDDVIQLRHVLTNTLLLTHDVACTHMATNQEFTTWPIDDHSRHNDTLFLIDLVDGDDSDPLKTKAGYFHLTHVPTRVHMWTHTKLLPDWAFKQQEINGNKKSPDKSFVWFVDQILADDTGEDIRNRTEVQPEKTVKSLNFFRKWGELQILMLQHNAGLTASHPYASGPIAWPYLFSGISFWTQNDSKQQIYLIGNVIGWWAASTCIFVYIGMVVGDMLGRRRGEEFIPDEVRNRLWNSGGYFLVAWAAHYFPFFLMNRQLFLHHYLPAHLCSALLAGSVFNFLVSERINYPVSVAGPTTRLRPLTRSDIGMPAGGTLIGFTILLAAAHAFLGPLTYGTPGLTGEQVNSRRLLTSWTLHFAAKKTHDAA